ncbi:hypothetical protein DPEC_G00371540, partial [Dallia pectoralis]
ADIVPDRPVSLHCFLYTSDGPGKCLSGVTERIGLYWVGEAGNELKNDPRLQVTQTSDCDITLTVRVQKEDNNRKWSCQLTVNKTKEISIDFTFMVPDSSHNPPHMAVGVAVGVTVGVALCVIAVVIKVHRRRTKNQMLADGSLSLNAINAPTPPVNNGQNQPADSITYASIGHINHKVPKEVNVHGEDTVTYASVMTSTGRR